jgi:hypothetical protein
LFTYSLMVINAFLTQLVFALTNCIRFAR